MSFLIFLGSPRGCCTNCCLASSHLWWHTLPSYRCSRRQVTRGCPSFSFQCTAATSTTSSFPLFWWTVISGHHLLLQETISGFQFLGEWVLVLPTLQALHILHSVSAVGYKINQSTADTGDCMLSQFTSFLSFSLSNGLFAPKYSRHCLNWRDKVQRKAKWWKQIDVS